MIDNDVVNKNPLARIKSLKETKNDKIRALSTEEVQALLSKTKQVYPDFYPLLFTALFTGMRQGELLGLTWDSINWVKGKIKIDKNYTHGRVGTPKTNKIRYPLKKKKRLLQKCHRCFTESSQNWEENDHQKENGF